jgi:hypothetical protein
MAACSFRNWRLLTYAFRKCYPNQTSITTNNVRLFSVIQPLHVNNNSTGDEVIDNIEETVHDELQDEFLSHDEIEETVVPADYIGAKCVNFSETFGLLRRCCLRPPCSMPCGRPLPLPSRSAYKVCLAAHRL